ncbi:MAG TPA: helix-turn-helix domain-containing protein [Candidatus Acidoferrales bacterium]|nr:helix-turn-helix domain-containing protein [Candidatus Acidoferrales bacterium]
MDIHTITKKNATCQDLLSCLYNLKPTDLHIFITVAQNPNSTLDQIATTVERDRSSVHRCIAKLLSANLVTKETKTIKGGGYYHTYTITEPERISAYARERVKEITGNLEILIETFEGNLKKVLETTQPS